MLKGGTTRTQKMNHSPQIEAILWANMLKGKWKIKLIYQGYIKWKESIKFISILYWYLRITTKYNPMRKPKPKNSINRFYNANWGMLILIIVVFELMQWSTIVSAYLWNPFLESRIIIWSSLRSIQLIFYKGLQLDWYHLWISVMHKSYRQNNTPIKATF